jgi:hypothetical protein
MKTRLNQECTSAEDATGALHFLIDNTISAVAPGDLPQAGIFLHQIVSSVDPKADVFMRIATLTDLTTEPKSRDNAVALNKSVYLSPRFTLDYADLPTAVQGKQIIQARIDDLILNWRLYQTQFVNPHNTDLPLAESSIVTSAKDALKTALKDVTTKTSDLAGFKVEYDNAVASAARAAVAAGAARRRAAQCGSFSNTLIQVNSALVTYRTANDLFRTDANAFRIAVESAADPSSNLYAVAQAHQTVIDTAANASWAESTSSKMLMIKLLTDTSTQCASLESEVLAAESEKKRADEAAGTAQTKISLAETALAAAQAIADAALVTVKNYCPLFDPLTDL